jgi:hypothetical protein
MTRHATADEIARLAAGDLRRRKAARISTHVAVCVQCTQVSQELAEVPAVLAATPYPPLPDTVNIRIEAAIRVEVSHRLATAPATEAGRRELPARSGRQQAGRSQLGWHLPGLSVPATRLAGAVGALALIGGGGYLLANNLPTAAGTGSSSSAAVPAPVQPMTKGPDVTYGSQGSQHTVDSVSSTTNFVPTQLRGQALSAYHEAQARGETGSQSPSHAGAPVTMSPMNSAAGSATGTETRLAGCIDAVGPGRNVLLLDLAKYEGKPATIIVFGNTGTSQAEVVVTANTCSAASPDVLARAPLGHL